MFILTAAAAAAAAAKSPQSCPTLCDPIDGSPPGSPIPGILQARTLEWAAVTEKTDFFFLFPRNLHKTWWFGKYHPNFTN